MKRVHQLRYFQNFEELGIRWSFRGRTLDLAPWIARYHIKGGWWKELGWLSCLQVVCS